MRIMNALNKRMSSMKVRKQLLGIYIIVILIPILIMGIYLTNMLCAMVVDNSIDEAKINIERIKERLGEKIKIANYVAETLYIDKKLECILSTQYEDVNELIKDYNEASEMDTYLTYYKELKSIRIYTSNKTLLNNSHFIQVSEEIEQQKWYQEALDRGSHMEWVYKYDEYKNQYNMSLIRCLKNTKGEMLGVLVITLEPIEIYGIIKDEPYETAIILNGEMVTSTGMQDVLQQKIDIIRRIQGETEASRPLKIQTDEGEGYIIFDNFTPGKTHVTDLEICMYVSVQAITEEIRHIIGKSLSIIVISACIATGLILAFIKRFSERIILVREEMAKVVAGNFKIRKSIKGNDEIGELYEDIYCTVQSVQALVKENYEARMQKEELKRRQKEMQFEMLASQINPHFLYNTLETIRMRALCSGDTELAHIVKMLSKLLRRNLEVSDKSVTIKSEIDMIRAYLEIQKFRFGERITYEIQYDIDENKYEILPLLVQPIIENAFIHGLEGKIGAGHIKCHIYSNQEQLYIIVEDNGLGIEEEKLTMLIASLEEGKEGISRVGLRNIYERIKLYYGKAYGIKIESRLNEGTKVIMNLPLIKEGEGCKS